MEINVNRVGKYHEFVFSDGNTTVNSGLLNKDELQGYGYLLLKAFNEILMELPEQEKVDLLTCDVFEQLVEDRNYYTEE